MIKKVLGLCLAVAVTFGLSGCGKKAAVSNRLEEIKQSGKLVVGLSADYAPYEFHINKDGKDQIVGFDVQLANEIAKDLGVKLEVKDMEFNSLVMSVPTKKVDLVISGMTPDEKRKEAVDFSDIYYLAEQGVVVKKENAEKYKKFADLAGKKVGAQMGAIQVDIAKTNIPNADIQQISNVNDLVMQTKAGKVEGLVAELPVAKTIVQNNPDLAIISETVKDDQGNGSAIAFMKNSPELAQAVNATIKRLQDSGLMDKYVSEANELASQAVDKPKN